MAVRVDRRSSVFPESLSKPQHLNLSHSDLRLLRCPYIQKGLVYSMPNLSHDFVWAVEKMKKSLSDNLVHFYPLAGRMATSAEGLVYIDCNDRGAEFIEASAPDIGVEEVTKETISDVVGELFALNGALNMDGHSLPLLAVQVTKLRNGIVVGITVNHSQL
ncbi:hypothetical protein SUGI_0872310 [Cryptomeria japonica]|nr:hypothetical protein SUGI_0872310 [Cryptomeria japonica]